MARTTRSRLAKRVGVEKNRLISASTSGPSTGRSIAFWTSPRHRELDSRRSKGRRELNCSLFFRSQCPTCCGSCQARRRFVCRRWSRLILTAWGSTASRIATNATSSPAALSWPTASRAQATTWHRGRSMPSTGASGHHRPTERGSWLLGAIWKMATTSYVSVLPWRNPYERFQHANLRLEM